MAVWTEMRGLLATPVCMFQDSVPQVCLVPGDLLGARALVAKAEAHRCLPAPP